MPASSTSWQREPFKECVPINYHADFDAEQFVRLKIGLIPRAMEDKWFIYYEEPYLFFHRSWTGQPVYRLRLATSPKGGATVTEALWSKELAVASKDGPDYQVQLIDFLVANLLLGQSRQFPLPPGLREPKPGVFQHHISGTGYPEIQTQHKSPRSQWEVEMHLNEGYTKLIGPGGISLDIPTECIPAQLRPMGSRFYLTVVWPQSPPGATVKELRDNPAQYIIEPLDE